MSAIDTIIADLERFNPALSGQSDDIGVADILSAMRGQFSGGTSSLVPDIIHTAYSRKASPLLASLQPPVTGKGETLTGYASVFYDDKGEMYIDGYLDWTAPGAFTDTIKQAYENMRRQGKQYLMPHLYQHSKQDHIGGVQHLGEDSKGVIYESKLAMGTPRAREVYELAKAGMLGTSFGYDPIIREKELHPKTRQVYFRLAKLICHEISSVSFPANPYTTALAKDVHGDTRRQEIYALQQRIAALQADISSLSQSRQRLALWHQQSEALYQAAMRLAVIVQNSESR